MKHESAIARRLVQQCASHPAGRVPAIIIAEAGVNHNGDPRIARKLIDAAKSAGADVVKFQTFKTENVVTRRVEMAAYQRLNAGAADTQFEMLKKLELQADDFRSLCEYAASIGIEFMSTPDDQESLDFLTDDLCMAVIKIGSGEVTNLPFLRRIAAKSKPMIVSTGMSSLGEVERALAVLRSDDRAAVTVLHCTSSYPCDEGDVNLLAMNTIRDAFKVPVGYSDHTLGIEVALAAVALGATVIEKHLTLDKGMTGPDHAASLDPNEFTQLVAAIRRVEASIGDGIKRITRSEIATKALVQRRIVTSREVRPGEVVGWSDLAFKRAESGIGVEYADLLIGMSFAKNLSEDTPILWSDVLAVLPHDV
jgi:N,N'-diacetyllegionaminate synthase